MRDAATVVQGGGARMRDPSIRWKPDMSNVNVLDKLQMLRKEKSCASLVSCLLLVPGAGSIVQRTKRGNLATPGQRSWYHGREEEV
jgi:hypothetical protein